MAETSRTRLLMIGEAAKAVLEKDERVAVARTFAELVNVDGFSEEMRKAERREGGVETSLRP